MTIEELLTELKHREIDLFIKDGGLAIDAPKGAVTTELKEKIGAFKNDILEVLNEDNTNPPPIKKTQHQGHMPLSEKQRGLWFINKFQEGAEAQYNIPWSCKILGKLDCLALGKAFNTAVQRHETLRTKFQEIDNEVVQVIEDELTLDIEPIPITESDIAARIDKHAVHVFNLIQGPLIKVDLLRLSRDEHILLVNIHHIISDGWSISILNKELNTLYEDYTKGMASSLASLPIQYADFVDWERQQMHEGSISEGIDFWKEKLAGAPALLELPTDRPRPSKQSFKGSSENFIVPKALKKQLNILAKEENTTLFSVLMATFQILLHRISGETDICVGVPFANRQLPELEELIGLFLNVSVFRNQIDTQSSYKDFLQYIHETSLAVQDYQGVPFERLVEVLQPERSLSYTPIFQVMLVLQTASDVGLNLQGLTTLPSQSDTHTSKFDLTMELVESPEGILGRLEYSTDLFDQSTIERLCQHYQILLEGIVENPDQSIDTLPLLSQPEKQQLLVNWNQTEAPYPRDRCIHSLFEEQVERSPDAIAVVYDDQQLTFSELNEKSNQLAHYLVEQGVGPEVRVGICLERSFEMIIGILGILKAGGGYVPIDSEYPKQRVEHILNDSGVAFLITQEKLRNTVFKEYCDSYLLLDQGWPKVSGNNSENPNIHVESQNLAYVIYTSGSTGKPKGVLIEHSAYLNHMQWMQATFEFSPEDKVLHKTPLSFDAAGWEWSLPLITGAQLILAKPGGHREPDYLLNLINDQQVTVLQVVPSLLNLLLEDSQKMQSLRYLFSGGEPLSINQCKAFQEQGLQTTLCNLYGPTEATIDSTYWFLNDGNLDTVPIGRPINNTQNHVLDKQLCPVPVGVVGELYISGVGLARGYLNRTDLTAEKFIPNPFSNTLGARLYKTGDLARYLPDGNIEHIGRVDHQVKVRGFRIELGEIENALTTQEGIREAIVLTHSRDGSDGNQYLAAYLVHEQGLDIDHSQLRENLKTSLPDYMVPAFFIQLDELPLTPNGKVDRKALPVPDAASLQTQEYIAPQTQIEKTLAAGWSEVLGIDLNKISIHNNFFELGGDSILCLQTITHAKNAGIKITPKQLFEYPSIAELSKVTQNVSTIKTEQGQITGSLPILPIQHWFFEKIEKDYQHFNQSFMLKTSEKLDENILTKALNALVLHHDVLRLRFSKSEDGWNQVITQWCTEQLVSSIDLSMLTRQAQRITLEEEASSVQKQLDIHRGPLLRATIFHMGKDLPDLLLIAIHHLAIDGVSWRILLSDLVTAYRYSEKDSEVKLPEKTTSYKDWAEQVESYSQSDSLRNELNYWQRLGLHTATPLPQDWQSKAEENTEASARTHNLSLSKENTQSLLQEVPAAYNTQINDVLLTALTLAFHQWTDNNSLLLDIEGHGREDIFDNVDLARTVGWFTSIYPVHLALDSPLDLGESIKSVKEQLRQIPEKGVGYGMLRYCNNDPAINSSLAEFPAAQVSFNYLGQFDQGMGKDSFLQWADEPTGAIHSPYQTRTYLIDVIGLIVHGRLQLNLIYSQAHYEAQTMEKLGAYLLKNLKDLIEHCSAPDNYGYTPSDFADADMSPDELNELMESFGAVQ